MITAPTYFLTLLFLSVLSQGCVAGGPNFLSRKNLCAFNSCRISVSGSFIQTIRGGSTASPEEDEAEGEYDEAKNEEAESVENDYSTSSTSTEPVRLMIQTNLGNAVLDHKVELMAARNRDIASVKKSLSRLLPSKPPILALELVSEGRVLDDEALIDDLIDEDDMEDEEDADGPSKRLLLNSIPPVDPKFATELAPKLKAHYEDDADTLSTEDLLQAYFCNQAAMTRNAQLLGNPDVKSETILKTDIHDEAKKLMEQLKKDVPEQIWERSLQPTKRSHNAEEYRGQRYRSGKGGARTNLKKSIQRNLNIHWGETIRNFVLFLFFGYFGGRNSLSRYLMLWGAPLCFILQARPVKMWTKIFFYMMTNPPGIVLSLLPAPQQAILSMDIEKAYIALYSNQADMSSDLSDCNNDLAISDAGNEEEDDGSSEGDDESEFDDEE